MKADDSFRDFDKTPLKDIDNLSGLGKIILLYIVIKQFIHFINIYRAFASTVL